MRFQFSEEMIQWMNGLVLNIIKNIDISNTAIFDEIKYYSTPLRQDVFQIATYLSGRPVSVMLIVS